MRSLTRCCSIIIDATLLIILKLRVRVFCIHAHTLCVHLYLHIRNTYVQTLLLLTFFILCYSLSWYMFQDVCDADTKFYSLGVDNVFCKITYGYKRIKILTLRKLEPSTLTEM